MEVPFFAAQAKFHKFDDKFHDVIIFIVCHLPYTITIERISQRTNSSKEVGSPTDLYTRKGS